MNQLYSIYFFINISNIFKNICVVALVRALVYACIEVLVFLYKFAEG